MKKTLIEIFKASLIIFIFVNVITLFIGIFIGTVLIDQNANETSDKICGKWLSKRHNYASSFQIGCRFIGYLKDDVK